MSKKISRSRGKKLGFPYFFNLPDYRYTSLLPALTSMFSKVYPTPGLYLGEVYQPNDMDSGQLNEVHTSEPGHEKGEDLVKDPNFDILQRVSIEDTLLKLNRSMSKYAIIRFCLDEESSEFRVKIIAMSNDLHWLTSVMDDNDNIFEMH